MVDGAQLQNILQEDADLLEQMVELEEETQYLLVHSDAGKLETLNRQKEKLITRMAELDEQRKKMFVAGTTLEQYLGSEEPRNRRELEELKKLILKRHVSLQKKMRINRYLLRHNLHFTHQAINCLFPEVKDAALYAASGEKDKQLPYPAGLVDSNA